jgi:hypothetical protein
LGVGAFGGIVYHCDRSRNLAVLMPLLSIERQTIQAQ